MVQLHKAQGTGRDEGEKEEGGCFLPLPAFTALPLLSTGEAADTSSDCTCVMARETCPQGVASLDLTWGMSPVLSETLDSGC